MSLMQDEGITASCQGQECKVVFEGDELQVRNLSTGDIYEEIKAADIIGSKIVQCGSARRVSTLEIYAYSIDKGSFFTSCTSQRGARKCRTVSLEFRDESTSVELSKRINCAAVPVRSNNTNKCKATGSADRKFLVFVNPVSGHGQATAVWENEVKPMLAKAGVETRVVLTQYANHAFDCVRTDEGLGSLLEYEVILAVGGDGLLFEIINGIAERPDSNTALESVAVSPIPGGTGNGLAKSLLFECGEEYSVANATYMALKGTSEPMDLSIVHTRNKTYHSFLLLGWGLISDIDLQSEGMRWMGESRLYVAAVYFALRNRRYAGVLSMFTGKGLDAEAEPPASSPSSSSSCRSPAIDHAPTSLPPLDEPLPVAEVEGSSSGSGWEVVRGSFLLVWVVQTSHATAGMYSGPGVSSDDGLFTVFVVEELSQLEILQLLVAMDTGGHASHPKVKTYRCSAYRIEPLPLTLALTDQRQGQGQGATGSSLLSSRTDSEGGGLYTLDGESVEYGPIQGLMKPGAARAKKIKMR
jgi:diacylglycerol kinase family enzyme